MDQYRIPCVIMRAGTSKGIFLKENDLPAPGPERDAMILQIFGSPDKRQINGLAGADPLTSKLAVIGPSKQPGCDVDYTFAQVSITDAVVDWNGNCGNISSGVAPFAIDESIVKCHEGLNEVTIWQVNTQKVMKSYVLVEDGKAKVTGDVAIAGVPGTGALIQMDMSGTAGAATGNNAFHLTAPRKEAEGSRLVMAEALRQAAMTPADITHVCAHATSTRANDETEAAALRNLFGNRLPAMTIAAHKSQLGHLLGAAGLAEAIITVQAMRTGVIPPTIRMEHLDPACEPVDCCPLTARVAAFDAAITNSAGIGGNNASLVLTRQQPQTTFPRRRDCQTLHVQALAWILPAAIVSGRDLLDHPEWRTPSPQHDARWLQLLGFSLRPGTGCPADETRIRRLWKLRDPARKLQAPTTNLTAWWITLRRAAAGLTPGQQEQYAGMLARELIAKDGQTDRAALSALLAEDNVAGVLVCQPNYFGIVEDFTGLADECHAHKALLAINSVASTLGVLRTPGEWGADIAMGDAQSLGLPAGRMRILLLAVAAALAGAAVSFAGLLGFVGLIVPHIMRRLVGDESRLLLPGCAMGGAVMLLLCDLASRMLFRPYELPVGIALSSIGGPFFVWLLLRQRKGRRHD